ncbi:hypothetical protein OH77DRAFT_1397521, partial [Trametes cingulata]
IGQEVSFVSGVLAGRTIRVELEELQKADLGRKYARKDKRPLDPPPVVACHFFEVTRSSPSAPAYEREFEPEQVQTLGTFCHVDLFAVPEEFSSGMVSRQPQTDGASPSTLTLSPLQMGSSYPAPQWSSTPLNLPPLVSSTPVSLPVQSQWTPFRTGMQPLLSSQQPDIVAWLGPFAIRESAKCTEMLSGGTFVESAAVDYRGKRTAMFVFPDLAVKMEGTFVLRYRVSTICSQRESAPHMPVLAECYGGPFKVYSTKEFPGLRPSTQLTKQLSLHGVRVNLRENERKRRKKSEIGAAGDGDGESPPTDASKQHSSSSGAQVQDPRAILPRPHANSDAGGRGSASGTSRSPTSSSEYVLRPPT